MAYALISQHRSPLGAVASVLSAGASPQMYFIAVYLQMTLLAPALYRLLRRHPLVVYLVTPLSLTMYELMAYMGIALTPLVRLFPVWLLFYVVGLDWERWRARLQEKQRAVLVALLISLAMQILAGFVWLRLGDYNMATTQLKISSMATSLCAIAAIMVLPAAAKRWLSKSALASLGDLSFGVYLSHMFVLAVVRKALALLEVPLVLDTLLAWVLTLLLSAVFCALANKLLPKRFAKALGTA